MLQALTRRRERDAFEKEALPHMDALYAYAVNLTRNSHDAQDLVQETFIKALKNFHRYQKGTNCKAWLFRILTNTFLNQQRAKKRRRSVENDALPDIELQVAEHHADQGIYRSVEAQVLDRMMSATVREAVDSLPPDFRTVLLLADLEDFSYKEIAEVVGCPVGTVMSRLYRARKQMQRKLADHAVREGIIPEPERDADGVVRLDQFRLRGKRAAGGGR
jgi:RNA polymerase sigma-70 factor (ECF subfamily)